MVAPTQVKCGSGRVAALAPTPLPSTASKRKSSRAGYSDSSTTLFEPVDLVDEEHVAGGEVQKDRAESALVVDRRPGADLDRHAKLVGDDVRERRLAEARRAAQQHVLDRLAAAARRLEKDAEVLADLLLADVLARAIAGAA